MLLVDLSTVPGWLVVGVLVSIVLFVLVFIWRLTGRLKRIEHGQTVLHFGEPEDRNDSMSREAT